MDSPYRHAQCSARIRGHQDANRGCRPCHACADHHARLLGMELADNLAFIQTFEVEF